MKIWLNEVPDGTEIWYAKKYTVGHGIVEGDCKGNKTMMTRKKIDNGDELFCNQYVYTSSEEVRQIVELNINERRKDLETELCTFKIELNYLNKCSEELDRI